MNAVTDLQGADLALEYIPIACIRPSTTAVQTLRRAHYSPDKLLELAANIGINGVLQPILVRPVAPDGTIQFEIVAGERRYLAADRAGLAHIPCVIRDLDTIQTLQAQLVENIAREQLSALEEATGFKEMLDQGTLLNAEKVGERIGKSRSYVYARLKLLDLIPAAREALAAGTLDASKGLLLARIKGDKMQTRALAWLADPGEHYSYRRLVEKLRDDFMIDLSRAPWLPGRDTLHTKAGDPIVACAQCPSCSRNDPELIDAIGEGREVCVDSPCFELKTKLHFARIRQDYEASGRNVLTGDAAKEVLDFRTGYMGSAVCGGYVRLDAECATVEFSEPEPKAKPGQSEDDIEDDPDWQAWSQRENDFTPPTYRELIGPLADIVLVQGPGGKLVEVAPVKAVAAALKTKGIDVPNALNLKVRRQPGRDDEPPEDAVKAAAERAREEERRKVEEEYRKRLALAVHAKYKGPLKLPELQMIADQLTEGWIGDIAGDHLYPDGFNIVKAKEAELLRMIVGCLLSIDAMNGDKPGFMLGMAQRLKIDPKKLRAEVVKDLKPVSAAPAEDDAKPKAKAKKKAVKK